MGDGVLTRDQILGLPPMLFGSIRWRKGLGAPVGDPCSAFRVLVEEHTVSQFRIGPGGRPEVIPGTGIWKAPELADCWSAPDEGDMHVVRFNARDVHLNAFPDGKYRITVELTGNWGTPRQGDPAFLQRFLGFRKIEPMAYYVSLKEKDHIVSLDFEVVNDLSLLRYFDERGRSRVTIHISLAAVEGAKSGPSSARIVFGKTGAQRPARRVRGWVHRCSPSVARRV